mmetsp:Transcript_5983/g.12595  ORF Transcript_5983/g.12595 Transcript_5983/m.12595 type:complete len:140 (-) Transcript_5983:42-461(-)
MAVHERSIIKNDTAISRPSGWNREKTSRLEKKDKSPLSLSSSVKSVSSQRSFLVAPGPETAIIGTRDGIHLLLGILLKAVTDTQSIRSAKSNQPVRKKRACPIINIYGISSRKATKLVSSLFQWDRKRYQQRQCRYHMD